MEKNRLLGVNFLIGMIIWIGFNLIGIYETTIQSMTSFGLIEFLILIFWLIMYGDQKKNNRGGKRNETENIRM